MFVAMLKKVSLPAVAAVLLLGSATNAEASVRYAMVEIRNELPFTVKYQVKWGNGQWKSTELAPGASMKHFWAFAQPGIPNNPGLDIRFDDDLRPGTQTIYHFLQPTHVVDTSSPSKMYVFRYDGPQKRFIDVFSIN